MNGRSLTTGISTSPKNSVTSPAPARRPDGLKPAISLPVSAGVLVSYVSPVFDTGTSQVNGQFYELAGMTTTNVHAQYRFSGTGALQDTRIRVGARNVFDKQPPLYSSNYGYLGSLHDGVGRFMYFELTKEF